MSAALGTLMGLSVTSGLNLYATVLATGLAIRLGWIAPPDSLSGLQGLADTTVLAAAAVLFVVEFVADKVPVVEHAWDLLHTVVRPVGAVWIGLLATSGWRMNPVAETVMLLFLGGTALTVHLGKAGTRLAAAATGGHLIGMGIALSLLEDAFSLGIAPLALIRPVIVAVVAGVALVLMLVLVPRGYRYLRAGARAGRRHL
jgi:hypothetical protein